MTRGGRRGVWETRYQEGHTGWDRGTVNPALEYWLESGAIEPCSILVPGCGNGYEVLALAERGFRVTAVDIAPTPVEALQERLAQAGLSARVVHADLLRWDPPGPFEAVYEQTFLSALEPGQWPRYAAWLARWVKPGGRLYALFMQTRGGAGPPYHCDPADMHVLFPDSLWSWTTPVPLRAPHPNGPEEWGYVITRREPLDGH